MSTDCDVFELKQTDTLAASYGIDPPVDMSAWSCRVVVKKTKSGTALIDQTLTEKNSAGTDFVGLIDTTPLQPGQYFIMARLQNGTTGESKEIHQTLRIAERGVF